MSLAPSGAAASSDPASGIDAVQDVCIADGRIVKVGQALKAPARHDRCVDVTGKVVCPGFIDIHVHLREPGLRVQGRRSRQGTRAAAAGGFTAVCLHGQYRRRSTTTAPSPTTSWPRRRSKASVRVYPIGAVTRGLKGETLSEMAELAEARLRGLLRRRQVRA